MLLLGLLVAGCGLPLAGRRVRPQRLPARTRGGWPRGWSRRAACCRRRCWCVTARVDPGNLYPSLDPLGWPGLPLGAALAVLVALLPAWLAPPPRCRAVAQPGRRAVSGVIELRARDRHLRGRRGAGPARRRPHRRRGRAVPGRRPHRRRASPRCSARSTGWCRTSPAAAGRPGARSPAWTPATHAAARARRTWSASSARTRSAGFVTDTVEEELAYGMEQLGVAAGRDAQAGRGDPRPARHRRAAPRHCGRSPAASSSGWRSASVLTVHPRRAGARRADLGARPDRGRGRAGRAHPAGARPRHHRGAGRAPARAGRAVRRPAGAADRRRLRASPATRPTLLAASPVAPPVVELGRLAGWDPLPLSVRDARRRAAAAARPPGRRRPGRPPHGRGAPGPC